MAFIGVDLHTNSFTICRLETNGDETFETFQLCQADLDRFCLSLSADDELAVEAHQDIVVLAIDDDRPRVPS